MGRNKIKVLNIKLLGLMQYLVLIQTMAFSIHVNFYVLLTDDITPIFTKTVPSQNICSSSLPKSQLILVKLSRKPAMHSELEFKIHSLQAANFLIFILSPYEKKKKRKFFQTILSQYLQTINEPSQAAKGQCATYKSNLVFRAKLKKNAENLTKWTHTYPHKQAGRLSQTSEGHNSSRKNSQRQKSKVHNCRGHNSRSPENYLYN